MLVVTSTWRCYLFWLAKGHRVDCACRNHPKGGANVSPQKLPCSASTNSDRQPCHVMTGRRLAITIRFCTVMSAVRTYGRTWLRSRHLLGSAAPLQLPATPLHPEHLCCRLLLHGQAVSPQQPVDQQVGCQMHCRCYWQGVRQLKRLP